MARQLPQLNAYGVFTLLSPFSITDVNYRCSSLQLISALVDQGTNVYDVYYAPRGLSDTQYQADIKNNIAIVTLESNDGPTIKVPSSYVDTAPVELAVPYSKLVLSVELGILPDELSLYQLIHDLQIMANNYVGVSSMPKLHKIPIKETISNPQHLLREAQRLSAVQHHISFYTGKVDADHALLLAKQRIQMLEEALIIANSKIPPDS